MEGADFGIGSEFVRRFIASAADIVEGFRHFTRDVDLVLDLTKEIELGGALFDLYAQSAGDILGQGLSQLAEFEQGGIGIGHEGAFSCDCPLK